MQTSPLLMLIILLAALSACDKPEPPTINLYRAAHIGDIDQVERNLSWNSEVNQPGPDGETALHVAARKGRLVMIKMLLKHGADIEVLNRQGHTPLTTALLARNTLVADYLVEQQASLDADRMLRESVLLGRTDRDVIEFLVKQGANLDKPDEEGNTALHLAITKGHRVIAKYLVQQGANIDKTDAFGRTPLELALELGQDDIARMLTKYGATAGNP